MSRSLSVRAISAAWLRGRARLCLGCLLLSLTSCAFAIEQARVSRRFEHIFNCPNPTLYGEGRGYRAEGCNVVAHFSCYENRHTSHETTLGGVLVESLVSSAMEPDTCLLEQSEQLPPATVISSGSRGTRELKLQAPIPGGHMRALAKPSEDAQHALLTFHVGGVLSAAPCQALLFRDGAAIRVRRVERLSDHEARLLVALHDLAGLDRATRFSGSACGSDFELDQPVRQALALFEMRFREEQERARLGLQETRIVVVPNAQGDSAGGGTAGAAARYDGHAGGPVR
jgi:hypothetical protein